MDSSMNDYELMDYRTYKILYARYLQTENKNGWDDRTVELVKMAGSLKGKSVIDLCAGGGRLSREALKQKPILVLACDKSSFMLRSMKDTSTLRRIPVDVYSLLKMCGPNSYDTIFCQQAVNYWLSTNTADELYRVLKPRGVFIFNTFNKKPSEDFAVKTYTIKDRKYCEVSWLYRKGYEEKVKHIQIVDGYEPHMTEFNWISPEKFDMLLHKFRIQSVRTCGTTVYKCTKEAK